MSPEKIKISLSIVTFLISLGAAHANTFSSGQDVANALNSRYNDTSSTCDNNPSYFCSGVIIRTNETTTLASRFYNTWEAYQPTLNREQDFLSFSFIGSADKLAIQNNIYKYSDTGFGIILSPAKEASFSSRCIYPTDGSSVLDKNHGCGKSISGDPVEGDDNSTCKGYNVTTAQEFVDLSKKGSNCSFSSQYKDTFQTALNAQKLIVSGTSGWNEMIINASDNYWSSTDPSKDGIQALWYSPIASNNTSSTYGLKGAQKEQQDYYTKTGQWIPIVEVDYQKPKSPFIFNSEDQIIDNAKIKQ